MSQLIGPPVGQGQKNLVTSRNNASLTESPGNLITSLYYTDANTTIEQVETNYNVGKAQQNLNNLNFGNSSTIMIDNQSFVGLIMIQMEFDDLQANESLPRGFGYQFIKEVSYSLGPTSNPNKTLSSQGILQTIMAECETAEKRSEVLRLGGQEAYSPGQKCSAVVFIPLPFSSICSKNPKKYYDAAMLHSPIRLTFTLARADEVYGGSAVHPTSLVSSRIILRQGELFNKSDSIRQTLAARPDDFSRYPFIDRYGYEDKFTVTNIANPVSILLNQFDDGDLLGITLSVVRDTDLVSTANQSTSPFNWHDITDVRLVNHNDVLYDAPGESMKFLAMLSQFGGGYFHNDILGAGTTSPFTGTPKDCYCYSFDFSAIKAACYDGEIQNVKSFASQSMRISFKMKVTGDFTLFTTLHYNGMVKTYARGTQITF